MGIVENIPVKIRDFLVPVDFVVLDMSPDSKVSIILGRPFFSTANAYIDAGMGEFKFNINGQEEHLTFKPRPERDSTVKEVHEEEPLEAPSPEEGNSEDYKIWRSCLGDLKIPNPRREVNRYLSTSF